MSLNADTENDGMDDGWEVAYMLDPLSDDADQDPDGDGYTNLKEYAAGSDPRDNSSVPGGATPVPAVSSMGFIIALVLLFILGCLKIGIGRRTVIILPVALFSIIFGTMLPTHSYAAQKIDALPGIQRVTAEFVNPEQARKILAAPKVYAKDTKIVTLDKDIEAAALTDRIQAMARALKNDVDLSYEYVHDKITYTPIYGSVKGADATLTDGVGNSFDQCSLMIALLRASGYTANYKYGTLRLTPAEVPPWLGTSSPTGLGYLVPSAGIPGKVWTYSNGDLAYLDIDHVWVEVEIEDANYVFDPAYKTHIVKEPIDISAAMQYERAAFLAGAKSGTSQGSDYVQNINKTNIANALSTYAGNLIQEIKTSYPGATLEDIVGGLVIIPAQGAVRQTSLPYTHSETIDYTWTEIPNSYRTSFTIQHEGINTLLYTDETYGKRLSIFYNASNQPVLTRDGSVLATGNAVTPDTHADITIIVDHPYPAQSNTYCDQTRTFSILTGRSYNVVNGWAETTRGMIEKHGKMLNQYRADGAAETSEPVLGESLAMMGFAWLAEVQMSDKLMDTMFNTAAIHHHVLGVCGQNESPYIDLPMGFYSTISLEDNSDAASASFFTAAGRSSAMEWGVIEQYQPNSAVCTVKLLDIANEGSSKIFEASASNWSSIKTQLASNGYSASELDNVQAYINAGYRVIVPHDGDLTQGEWQGIGFLAVNSANTGIGHIISGGLKGGFGDTVWTTDSNTVSSTSNQGSSSVTNDTVGEPIDFVTGYYLYDHSDLTLGNGPEPFSMAFKRSYSSGNRLTDGPLGLGWTHGYDTRATLDNDGFVGQGERSPIDAAAVIAEVYATMDLLMASRDYDRIVIASIGHRWYMDQLIENVVSINIPGATKRFVKLADGSFNAPPGDGSLLTVEPGNTYLVRSKHGGKMAFNTDGLIDTWTDLNGNALTFTYASGVLQQISNGMAKTLSLSYQNGRIDQVSDGTGRQVSYEYDAQGNLEWFTDAMGHRTRFEYDIPGRLTQIYYPDRPGNPFVSSTYNLNDQVIIQVDADGNAWQYYISGYRNEEENPLGQGHIGYYDKNGNAVRRIDPLGNETILAYDGHERIIRQTLPQGNYTKYVYDGLHNPVTVTQYPKPGSSAAPIINQFTYDPVFNKILTSIDPLNRITTFVYDSHGNLVRMEQPEVNGVVPVTMMTYNSRGRILTQTDPEGRVTCYTYDPATGDLLSMIIDDGGLNLTTGYGYDTVGNITSLTDPKGHTTTFTFNDLRLPEQETGPAPLNYVTAYDYDEQGRLIETRRQTGDVSQPWQTESVTYTATGKRYIVTDPEGNSTTHVYDTAGRLWKVTNAENQTTEYAYDDAGRLFKVIDPKRQTAREITYTANSFKLTETDANANTTHYRYDDFDRLKRTTFPDGSNEAYIWNKAGNLTYRFTRAGQTISFTYDDLNRMVSKTLPGSDTITYTYDLTGLQEGVTDSQGTIDHTYDNALRLTSVTYPDGRTIGYQYDSNSNRTQLTYPDNTYVTYTYDVLNRITDIKQAGTTLLAHYDYDALSRRTSLTYGNGATTTYSYKIDNDLASIALAHAAGTATYTFTTNHIGIRTQTAIDDYRFVYRQADTVSTAYTSNNLNQYTDMGSISPTYDGNGNLTSDGTNTNTYTYDTENQLITAITPNHTATYAYDPMGRRIEKDVDGKTTLYLHDGNQVILEYNSTGTELRRYIYGPGIDQPICMITNSATYYYQFDGSGSVVAQTDETGALRKIYAYDVFGQPNGISYLGNPYLYTGREYDPETGLYYYWARYYNPVIGRFLQPDPIGYSDGMNLYRYSQNNPIMFMDPNGLVWETIDHNYHGVHNWRRGFLNWISRKIGSGWEPGIPGSDPSDYEGAKRDVVQIWLHDVDNPSRDSEYEIGTIRTIPQTYTKKPIPKPNELWDPTTTHYWQPSVSTKTYDDYPNSTIQSSGKRKY